MQRRKKQKKQEIDKEEKAKMDLIMAKIGKEIKTDFEI